MVLNLNGNEFLRLTGARGTTVEVLAGRVWITEAGRERDAFIVPGMTYAVAGNGLVVVGIDAGAAAAPARIAIWPPLLRWLRERTAVIVRRFADGAVERTAIGELEGLSDHSLRDIGLSRDQIGSVARGR